MKRIVCLVLMVIAAGYLRNPLPVYGEEKPAVQIIQLRSQAWVVSEEDASEKFGLTEWDWKPLDFVQNDFEDRAETALDRATGLMWQKTITEGHMAYKDTLKYLKELNEQKFAGYDDWRLPTIPELHTEPAKRIIEFLYRSHLPSSIIRSLQLLERRSLPIAG